MHSTARRAAPRPEAGFNAAPLWAMARGPYLARCDLRRLPGAWEVCVFIDDTLLLSCNCATQVEANTVSSGWRARLIASGWSQAPEWAGVDAWTLGSYGQARSRS